MGIRNLIIKKFNSLTGGNKDGLDTQLPRFTPLEKKFFGKTLYIHDIASFHIGEYEIFSLEMYKFNSDNDKPYIIDCGANIGMSIIYFKNLYPHCRITAFEADDYIFEFLKKNVKSYQLNEIELINKAVWNEEGMLSFFAEGGAGGRLEHKIVDEKSKKKVQTIRLKEYLTGEKVDFLKIDIEGAEYEVIKDCKEELQNVENIFIEYHSFEERRQNLHDILDILQQAGFIYHIKEANTRKYPYIDRSLNNGMDLQLNIFCYRK